VSDLAELVYFC